MIVGVIIDLGDKIEDLEGVNGGDICSLKVEDGMGSEQVGGGNWL